MTTTYWVSTTRWTCLVVIGHDGRITRQSARYLHSWAVGECFAAWLVHIRARLKGVRVVNLEDVIWTS